MPGLAAANLVPSNEIRGHAIMNYQIKLNGGSATHLSSHATAQSDLSFPLHFILVILLPPGEYTVTLAGCTINHLQHDSRCQFVVSLTSALSGLKDMDRVPGSRWIRH